MSIFAGSTPFTLKQMIIAVRRKGEPMSDLIDRRAAIDAIDAACVKYDISPHYDDKRSDKEKFFDWWDMHKVLSMQILNNLPSIQPEPHWIPCSERMPNNYDYQLLTEEVHYTTGKIVRCVLIAYYDDEDDVWMSAEESPEAISYPIAWMPLPEPYKGGETE